MNRKKGTSITDSVHALRRRIGELERWYHGQDRQIRFLERERQKLSALVNHTDAGFLVFDADLSTTWFNNVCRAWFDKNPAIDSNRSATCNELLCRSRQICAECPAARALRTSRVSHREFCFEIEDIERHVYATAMPIKTMDNSVDECILMLQDITDLEVLRRSQDELLRAKESAESANRAKSEFLANMSHEVRTPMTGILSMSTHLIDTPLSSQQQECVNIIKSSGESLLTVLNDILDFSRIEAGRLLIEPAPFDPTVIVEDVALLVAEKAAEKNIEIVVRYAQEMPHCLIGDGGRIRQALLNLVVNAVKFTHEGHILIGVEDQEKNGKEARLRFSVEDTGIGIPADKLLSVFEKFTQVDGSITRRYGGTGLGLSITKQLVELMNGDISVESKASGSTFAFTLTLPRSNNAGSLGRRTNLGGLRVLVLHKWERIRTILVDQISDWKARADGVSCGNEAVMVIRAAYATGTPYHAVVVAHDIVDMTALELAKRITADPELKSTAIILLTTLMRQEDMERLQARGLNVCLAPLMRPSQLLALLSSVWHRQD